MKTIYSLLLASAFILQANAEEPRRFKFVDGRSIKGQFIDTNPKANEWLYVRYDSISDRGIELELMTGETSIWRAYVQPLGVANRKYRQEVWVQIDEGKISVISQGVRTIRETRNLETGELVSRTVTDNNPE